VFKIVAGMHLIVRPNLDGCQSLAVGRIIGEPQAGQNG
jgi:hypothetical protein